MPEWWSGGVAKSSRSCVAHVLHTSKQCREVESRVWGDGRSNDRGINMSWSSFVSRPLPEHNPASPRLSTMVKIDETKNSSSFLMLFLNRPGSEIDAPLCCEVLVIQRHCSSRPAC